VRKTTPAKTHFTLHKSRYASNILGRQIRIQKLRQRRIAIPLRQHNTPIHLRNIRRLQPRHLIRLLQPLLPRQTARRDIPVLHPLDAPGDRNSLPQRLGKRLVVLVTGKSNALGVEARQVPVPALGQGGGGPVGGVEDDVGGGEAELQGQLGVGEEDDGAHEEQSGGEGDEAVGRGADVVDALLWVPVELAGDVLVAFDNHEGALGVVDDDVGDGDLAGRYALFELEGPAGADADDGGEEGEQQDGEEGHAVFFGDGEDEDGK